MKTPGLRRLAETGPLVLAVVALPFSIFLCHLGLALFFLQWVLQGRWTEKWRGLSQSPLAMLYVAFFALHIAGIFYSQDSGNAVFDLEKKIAFVLLPVLIASSQLEKSDVRFIFKAFVFACLAASLACLIPAIVKVAVRGAPFNLHDYTASSFYAFYHQKENAWKYLSYNELTAPLNLHPSYFALYISFSIGLVFHLHREAFHSYSPARKGMTVLVVVYFALFVLLISSRIIIVGMILVLLWDGLRMFRNLSLPWRIPATAGICLLVIGFLYLNPVTRFRCFGEIATTWPYRENGLQTQSTTIRASLWAMSMQALPDINPFYGTGTGDVQHRVQLVADRNQITNVLNTYDPHNQYLQTLIGLGFIGLLSLLGCFFIPAYLAYRSRNRLYLFFIFLFSLLCLTESALELQKGIAYFSIINSLLLFKYAPLDFRWAKQPA